MLEKDSNDVSQRNRDSVDASQKIIELNKKVEKVREDIYRLPGIEVGKDEQMAQLQAGFHFDFWRLYWQRQSCARFAGT